MSNSAGAQNAKAENGTQEVKKEPQEGEKVPLFILKFWDFHKLDFKNYQTSKKGSENKDFSTFSDP